MPKPSQPMPPLRFDDPLSLAAWLRTQRDDATAQEPLQLFALIDVARLTKADRARIEQLLAEHGVQPINLYGDLEGLALADLGPRLVAMDDAVFDLMVAFGWRTHAISYLLGATSKDALASHLQSLREVTLPDGDQALFRFQDVQVTSHLFELLTPGLGNKLLGPLSLWATPDVCGCVHLLKPREGDVSSGALRFDQRVFDALNEALRVYTVADQVRDVDTTLLPQDAPCEARRIVRARLKDAAALGLSLHSDQALFVALSLQLPEGFAMKPPFSDAIEKARLGRCSFGDALGQVPRQDWHDWNEWLDQQDTLA
jgi:Domain of unknown function (DUF4123)